MKIRYPSPFFIRIRLICATILLLSGLFFLWLALDRPMPTAELAMAKQERELFLPVGHTLCSAPLDFGDNFTQDPFYKDKRSWFVRNISGRHYVTIMEHKAPLWWRPWYWISSLTPIPSSPSQPLAGCIVNVASTTVEDARLHSWLVTAVSTDPRIVRVEVALCPVSLDEQNSEGGDAAREVTFPLAAYDPANGIWSGVYTQSLDFTQPDWEVLQIRLHGYDADGTLLAEFQSK